MKKLKVLGLVLVGLIAACGGASDEEVETAKKNAEGRGFTVTGVDNLQSSIRVYVTLGRCAAFMVYTDNNPYLRIELAQPGTDDETTSIKVDDPQVSNLQKNLAFAPCFPQAVVTSVPTTTP